MTIFAYLLLLFSVMACNTADSGQGASERILDKSAFSKYWYQGKAELNSYDLTQYRYGEPREGEAVLIFVTEDFSRVKQVKLDRPDQNKAEAQKVLKLNMTRNFKTGIYPYSTMVSVFTPVYEQEPAVKLTSSVQEWCGHTFTQLNRKAGAYTGQLFSYFEEEGDQQLQLQARAEDDLWNLIRLNPNEVPVGKVALIPGLTDQRFTHIPLAAQQATITIAPAKQALAGFGASQLMVCTVTYLDYPRALRIFYTDKFPYEIAGWEEVRKLENGEQETSRATRKAVLLQDYWTKNSNKFSPLRQDLKLKP
ncbi:hypothetical protein ACXYMU_18800 [Pontibacter sp. CAU 1760]